MTEVKHQKLTCPYCGCEDFNLIKSEGLDNTLIILCNKCYRPTSETIHYERSKQEWNSFKDLIPRDNK